VAYVYRVMVRRSLFFVLLMAVSITGAFCLFLFNSLGRLDFRGTTSTNRCLFCIDIPRIYFCEYIHPGCSASSRSAFRNLLYGLRSGAGIIGIAPSSTRHQDPPYTRMRSIFSGSPGRFSLHCQLYRDFLLRVRIYAFTPDWQDWIL
jgi:hypothetical protein